MRSGSAYLVLALLLSAASINAQTPGGPANWCRGGSFTRESTDFYVATVKGRKGSRTYFYNDWPDNCPTGSSCRSKAYVVAGDKMVVSRLREGFYCAWFVPVKGSPTVGWVTASGLTLSDEKSGHETETWLGEWADGENTIKFTDNKLRGYLNVTGNAFWKGLGDNVHIGELDGRSEPIDGVLEYSDGDDEYDCRATMRLVPGFLNVSDNMNCGGANVTFSGVYRKRSKHRVR